MTFNDVCSVLNLVRVYCHQCLHPLTHLAVVVVVVVIVVVDVVVVVINSTFN